MKNKRTRKSMKVLSVATMIGLTFSNMSLGHAEETKSRPIVANEEGPTAGILVTNNDKTPSSALLSPEKLAELTKKGEKSIEAAAASYLKKKLAGKESLSTYETHKPDELVSVIVELKGQTVSDMTETVGATQLSLNKAQSLVKADIETTKNAVMSTLSIGKSKSAKPAVFKHEFEHVFKGFSIEHIKYSDIESIKDLPGVKAVTLQKTFYPAMNQQHELTGIKNVWNGSSVGKPTGYKGEGMLIAIVDTGVDYTHEAFPDPKDQSKLRIKKGKFTRPDGTTSLKVVDGYNWADQNDDIIPRVEDPNNATSSHGVHVAGIAAGSGPVMQGVAPEAQIIAEKVFSDHQAGALTEDIIKGIDHASALGADTINMSLGSSSSFDTRDANDPLGIAIRNATDEGHIVVVAAGNASNAYADRGRGLGESIKIGETPDLNKIGNPGVYPDSFTVAAANNLVSNHSYTFSGDGLNNTFSGEGLDDWHWNDDKNKIYSLVTLGGKVGELSDYKDIDVTGKVVLVKRGTINFGEKVANAKQKGAVGIIVYNGSATQAKPEPQGFSSIPFSFLSYEDGMMLEGKFKELSCDDDGGIVIGPMSANDPVSIDFAIQGEKIGSAFAESNPGQPTDFTSWGTTSDLLLKPEIMAPGHAIMSSVRTIDPNQHNGYESEDGTSMAAPYVAGAVADVMQGLIAKGFTPGTRAFAQLTKNVLMNTSIPAKRDFVNGDNSINRNDYMTEYQPRRQGAGMIRPDLALQTPVVVSGSTGTGSISLKEIGKEASFTITAQNLTNKAVTYKLTGTVMTDILKDSLKTNSDNIRSRYLDDAKLSFDNKEITIPANGTKRVTVSFTLGASALKNTFIEGYIYLEPTDSNLPLLNVPYNGFYGDWDEPTIIDTKDTTNVWGNSGGGTQLALQVGPLYLGYDQIFGIPTTEAQKALGDKFYAFGLGFYPVPAISLLRSARNLNIDVVDKDHNVVSHITNDEWVVKTDPYSGGYPSALQENWVWYGWNQAVDLPDGQYYFAMTATADGSNTKPQPTVYLPMYKDTTAPTLNILRSKDYDEKTHPETTNNDSYTVRWTMDDGDAGFVDGNVFLAVNGSEPFTTYRDDVKQNEDGSYELNIPGLNEGLNTITIAPMDKVGNQGEPHTVVVKKTTKHVWIDLSTATLGNKVPSMYWDVDGKPGDEFTLNFDAFGPKNGVKKLQAIVLRDYYDNASIIGSPVDLNVEDLVTETPAYAEYSQYQIKGKFTIPATLEKGQYYVKFVALADGENWNDQTTSAIGIKTYVDTDAPTMTINPTKMKAYVEKTGDPVSLMINTSATDSVSNSHGFKLDVAVDGNAPKTMGSVTNSSTTAQTFRYPVVLDNGVHTLQLTATDAVGNTRNTTFSVNVQSDKVTVTNDGTTTDVAINVAPYKDGTRQPEIKLEMDEFNIEGFDPWVSGYLVSPYGNTKNYSSNPDLVPILLVGNQQNVANLNYMPDAIPSWNRPIGDVYDFYYVRVGYDDPSSIPQGDSEFPVTMIDYLGHETTIKVPVHKNSYIPKVKFDEAIIDATGTATFFTYDSTFTVNGNVTAVNNNFYAEWVDWNRRVAGEDNFYKNLFDPTSAWRSGPYDDAFNQLGGDIPAGYNNEPGVKRFSMPTGELKPGANFFEIDGGSTISENPAHPFAGNHPLVFNVVVYRLGAAENADQALATMASEKLSWEAIKGLNTDSTNVLTHLSLPTVDKENKADITWKSSDESIVTPDGHVYRPEVDTHVTLTAITTVGEATGTKTFTVTVKAKNGDDRFAVAEDASFLTWDVIRGANTNENDVAQALTLPTRSSNGSKISWTSDDVAHITNQGRVYLPLFNEGDAHVELVAKFTRNKSTFYKTFHLTVLKDSKNEERTKVLQAANSIETSDLLGDNTSDLDITKDLTFPTTVGTNGVEIRWESDAPDVIANDGKVTKPAQNQYIRVTAYLKLGNLGLAKPFYFFVRSEDTSYDASVVAAKASITWNVIKNANSAQNAVKSALTLPTKGANDTNIKWSSNVPSIIGANGTVKRPSYVMGNRTVTLTATITKGNASTTKAFTVTVLRYESPIKLTVTTKSVDDNDTVISGKTEANATVIVKNKGFQIGSGKANAKGDFSVKFAAQKAGTTLSVYATNTIGNQSLTTTFTVADKTAPKAPKVNTVDDNDRVFTGVTEPNAVITIKLGTKVIATGKADSKGVFQVKIAKQKAGTMLTVTAKDLAGNVSTFSKVTVLDRTAPTKPSITSLVGSSKYVTEIKGKAEANAIVVIKVGNSVIAKGKATSKGTFSIKLPKKVKRGTTFTVYATDAAGNNSISIKRK
ncbi:immunoglobulin-like domain-containing protein [Neobacillus drentensis]|uniref:immunoglobulin-like domain-containing protein n=1 Tax=Neobacillus drentensis TaxID=220684 RepID=UPI0030039E51